jgi:hypothetical protein
MFGKMRAKRVLQRGGENRVFHGASLVGYSGMDIQPQQAENARHSPGATQKQDTAWDDAGASFRHGRISR